MTYPDDHQEADMQIAEDLLKELESMDEQYASAKPDAGRGGDVPDGSYQVCVENVSFARAKKDGRTLLKWKLRVVSGPHTKRVLWKNNMFSTDDNKRFLKGDLEICGLQLAKLSDLPSRLPELLDVNLEVRKTTSKRNGIDYANVYFQRRIQVSSAAPTDGDAPPF